MNNSPRLWLVAIYVVAIICFIALMGFVRTVGAQDVHHHAGASETVDQFYSSWYAPNAGNPRTASCCNKTDCAPAYIEYKNGHWYGRRRFDTTLLLIPDALIESNQADPRESPDGESHICVNSSLQVLCVVLGSGI